MIFSRLKENNKNQSKLYGILSNVSITGLFISVALIVLITTQVIKLNSVIVTIIALFLASCIACVLGLPWAKRLENKKHKKICIAFLIAVAVCYILWVVCIFLVMNILVKADSQTASTLNGSLTFIKISIIITMQFMVASLIGNVVTKYKKSLLPFQVITYISNIFVDFYFTFFMLCLKIDETKAIQINSNAKFLTSKAMIVLIILAVLFTAISNKLMRVIETRKLKNITEDMSQTRVIGNENDEVNEDSMEAKLEKIKNLYEKQLITKEEYEEKRAEIIKNL